MLGVGWTEMLVIGVVALIVIGPKDLPMVMGKIGKVMGQVQRMGREFQRELNKTTGLDEVRNLRTSITAPLQKTADEIRKDFNAIGKDGKQTPTGALKPTDPKTESVVEAIQQQAGMTPAKAQPVKAPARTAAPAAKAGAAKTRSAATGTAPKATRKPAAKSAAAQATPASRAVKTGAAAPAADKPVNVKAPRKRSAKSVDSAAVAAEKAPPKPRAPRKKAAAPAGKTE